ncbi:hypothetical protein K9M79_08760 [Candidatus Woesearchaeota archaeon]|nr:hypothetical protein [Candidatus Woesearchaeota archaeon]
MKKNLIFLLCIFLLCISFAYALPGDWVGEASIAQNPVASGTEVSVYSGSVLLAETITPSSVAGKAHFGDDFYVLVFETTDNTDLSFKICGINAYNTTFSSGTHQKILNVNKVADGTYGCTCDAVCTGGHCINGISDGVCSSTNFYCDNDGICESAYNETVTNCRTDCRVQSSSGGSSYTPKTTTPLTGDIKVSGNKTVITVDKDYPESVILVEEGSEETSLDFSNLLVKNNGKNVVTLNNNSIRIEKNTTIDQLIIEIAADTIIEGSDKWDGEIMLPTIKEKTSVIVPAQDGQEAIVSEIIEIGLEDENLVFSKAVRMYFKGQSDKQIAYTKGNDVHKITTICLEDSQAAGDSLPLGGDCRIIVGDDLIVWTKHFTKFVTYTYQEPTVAEPTIEKDVNASEETVNETIQDELPAQQLQEVKEDADSDGIVSLTGRAISGVFNGIKNSYTWLLLIIVIAAIVVGVYKGSTNNVSHLHTKARMLHKMADNCHMRGQISKSQKLHAEANELHRKAMRLKRNS